MKPLVPRRLLVIVAAALTAASCFEEPAVPTQSTRDRLLDEAFAELQSDPGLAARKLAEAGPGSVLETARIASWADCLERASASANDWREFLAASPPPAEAGRARLRLIAALIAEGNVAAAAEERSRLDESAGPAADELLVTVGDEPVRAAAARRLAVASPRFLDTYDRNLDRRLLAVLGPEERLLRSRAWRRAGAPARAVAELRPQRWRGTAENARRTELARAELEAGSPRRALRMLPDGDDAVATDLVLRARAWRQRAWGLWPARSADTAFDSCRSTAERALNREPDPEEQSAALALVLECATESGRLEVAWGAWRALEGRVWVDPRREWLGRRLGVAIAVRGGAPERVHAIADALPTSARCLRYWIASTTPQSDSGLETLARVAVPDLYAVWSLEDLGQAAPSQSWALPDAEPSDPPFSVQRLLDAGADREAAGEWRRIRSQRPPSPGEAVAGAQLADQLGQAHEAIAWLRSGFPELGTVEMGASPPNVVAAYLPLRWRTALTAAAAEFGLDPWLLAGIARQESTFTAHAVSPRGAVGAMQLLPSTAVGHARALGLGAAPDLRDAELNLRLGARELARLVRRFGAVEPALAAYNAGETRVRAWWTKQPDRRRFTEDIPIPETYTYVRRVVYLREAYRQFYDNPRRHPS